MHHCRAGLQETPQSVPVLISASLGSKGANWLHLASPFFEDYAIFPFSPSIINIWHCYAFLAGVGVAPCLLIESLGLPEKPPGHCYCLVT